MNYINVKFISEKEIFADKKVIGKTFENKSKILKIKIPIQFKDWNLFLEFEKYNGNKFITPKLEIENIDGEYYSKYEILNSLLDVEGYLKMELIFKKDDVIFKSYALDFRILTSINASEEIPTKYPDFVGEVQNIINKIELEGNGDKYLADDGTYKNIDIIGSSELKDNKLVVLGDSLSSHDTVTKSWPDYVSDLGANVSNFSVGGATLTPTTDNNITSQIAQIPVNFDGIIFVLMGGNDGLQGIPIGSNFDEGTNTFKGALKQVIFHLQSNFPKSKLLFATPPKLFDDVGGPTQKILLDYVNAILEISSMLSVPCLNLYSNLGIVPSVPAMKNIFFQDDGVHFTEEGQSFLADKIVKYISNPIINNNIESNSFDENQNVISTSVKSIQVVASLPEIEDEGVLYLVKES